MPDPRGVSDHYSRTGLVSGIRDGLAAIGKSPTNVTLDDLAPVDEFHIGGRQATHDLLEQLALSASDHLLDVGCGLGGLARMAAHRFGCTVTGIDLTPEYVETGNELCRWLGLEHQVRLQHGDAVSIGLTESTVSCACMLHVGMNIVDKRALFAEVARVLRNGALFAIYDVMRTGNGELTYPVPWAEDPSLDAVDRLERYQEGLKAAGFTVVATRNRRDFALAYFDRQRAVAEAPGPARLGLHLLTGKRRPDQVRSMIENIGSGRLAPVELLARKM